jgi:GTP-binding protein
MAHHAPNPLGAPRAGKDLVVRDHQTPAPLVGLSREADQGWGEGESALSCSCDDLEAGRVLFAGECRFVQAAQALDHLPPPAGPEIAFAGRSNVGKSSLLNALTGRHALARVSAAPGRTRQLNFFDLAGRLTLVDMPGYGYARAPQDVKADWQGLMFDYLRGRPTLRRVMLLLDARIEVKPSDTAVLDLLDRAAVAFQIVLTKTDAVKPPALVRKLAEAARLARAHPAAHPEVLPTSSETGEGMAELRAALAGLAEPVGR